MADARKLALMLCLVCWIASAAFAPAEETQPTSSPTTRPAAEGPTTAPADVAELPELTARLGHRDYRVRDKAMAALKRLGPAAKAPLQAAAGSDDLEVRLRARRLLRHLIIGDRELHAVGCYEAAEGTGKKIEGHDQAKLKIVVDRPGKQVTLVLTAYEPVRWELAEAKGSLIRRVIVSGYHLQEIRGLPAGCKVTRLERKGGDEEAFYAVYSRQSKRFARMQRTLKSLTDLPMKSFQGAYKLDGTVKVN